MIIPIKTKPEPLNVNHALKVLRQHGIVAMKHCFKLAVLTDNGYDEVKSFKHKTSIKSFEIVLKCGRTFLIRELFHLQKEIAEKRKIHNIELNFKNSRPNNGTA